MRIQILGGILFIVTLGLLFKSDLVSAEPPQTADPAWFQCAQDADCVVLEGECGWRAVNKTYTDAAQRFFDYLRPMVECAEGGYPEPRPPAVCRQRQCAVPEKDEGLGE